MAMGSSQELSAQASYDAFWPRMTEEVRNMDGSGLKAQELPLARIKKIMKLDDDVKMISAEAPVLFSKAAGMFITELTMRAWIHTEDNKRRTLQRNDIAMAITKYDQFDFLIDIVPRDDIKPSKAREESSVRMVPEQVGYYFQLAQQQQQQQQQQEQQQQEQHQQQPEQQQQRNMQQVVQQQQHQGGQDNAAAGGDQHQQNMAPQVIQLAPTQAMSNPMVPLQGGIQIVQQIVGPNGEIQQIPIQLTNQQLQLIRTQMTGTPQQPLVIQTAPIQAGNLVSHEQQQQQQQVPGQIQLQGQHQVYTIQQD